MNHTPPPASTDDARQDLDPAFPAAHPRPRHGWVNDPNGLCRVDGVWHVFFQFNPDSARHDRIHWGHLSSPDLVNWTEEPIALEPSADGPDSAGCWSGVMTFEDAEPTAVYSGITDHDHTSQVTLVRGTADLRSWGPQRHVAAGVPDDPDVVVVRDPFLFTYAGRRWAIQGAGLSDGRAALLLYDAEDLREWSYLGVWLTSQAVGVPENARASAWECPQLVCLDGSGENGEPTGGQWVLLVSRWAWPPDSDAGSAQLLNTVAMFVDLEESTGSAALHPPLSIRVSGSSDVDTGSSFYAPQLLALPESTVMLGWARETSSVDVTDARGWSGLLTWPRVLSVAEGTLISAPHPSCEGWRDGAEQLVPAATEAELPDAADVVVGAPGAETQDLLKLHAVNADGTRTLVHQGRAHRLVIDRSIIEVYPLDGAATTTRVEPEEGQRWSLRSETQPLSWWALRQWIPG